MTKQIKSTPLTLLNLAKADKKLDELKTVELANGEFTLEISNTFRLTQIQRFLIDLQEAAETLRKEKVDMDDVSNLILITQMLIFKYFTKLPIQHLKMDDKKDISKLITVAKQLLDMGIFEELGEALDKDEVAKIEKAIEKSEIMKNSMGEMFTNIGLEEMKKNEEAEFLAVNQEISEIKEEGE